MCKSAFALLVAFALGCGDVTESPDADASSSGIALTGATGWQDGGGDEGAVADDSGGVALDVGDGGPGAAEGSGPTGCRRVDVLVSIDNSGSMEEEIEALSGPVFDSFPQSLLAIHDGLEDFHLGVIDACNAPSHLHDTGASGACAYSTGKNFMSSTSPALLEEYRCVTELVDVGYQGTEDDCSGDDDDEQPANTAADAVSMPAIAGANAGFMRDDAILFVVAITDEEEKPIPEQSAQEIADKIVAAKGSMEDVVFLGIGGGSDCEGPYGGADEAALLRDVSQIFANADRGMFWDLCDGDLETAFQAALMLVDGACSEYEPAG